jgi:hypothetical protein
MAIPQASHRIWSDLVTGRRVVALEFLAAKLLIARLRLVMQMEREPATLARCALELHRLYAENCGLPSARRDLETLARER